MTDPQHAHAPTLAALRIVRAPIEGDELRLAIDDGLALNPWRLVVSLTFIAKALLGRLPPDFDLEAMLNDIEIEADIDNMLGDEDD
jgi:hypothetical protein